MIQILLVSGLVTLVVALVAYQIYQMRWLSHHGRKVIALVTSIKQETGKSPWGFARDNYYVTAAWTDPRTGRRYTFWTWIMNSRPSFTKGSLIPVLIDPGNPECYTLNL
jgi:hypothetical protein